MVDSSEANSTALFKGINVFAQKFDTNGNTEGHLNNDQNSIPNNENKSDADNQKNREQENSMTNIEAKIAPSADDLKES